MESRTLYYKLLMDDLLIYLLTELIGGPSSRRRKFHHEETECVRDLDGPFGQFCVQRFGVGLSKTQSS